jgi:hypothetical protein
MTAVLIADIGRDALLTFLQAQMPAQIAALNAARTGKHTLVPIASWSASSQVAQPEYPAVYVLPQTNGFRGTQLNVNLDEQMQVYVWVQCGDSDEETNQQDLQGYMAAVVNAVIANLKGGNPLNNGVQVLFGHGDGAENVITWGPSQMDAKSGPYYVDAYLALTLFYSEVV